MFKEFLGRAFDFKGRTSRKAFWLTVLTFGIIELIALVIAVSYSPPDSDGMSAGANILVAITFIPWLSLVIRRLHDTNRSGWWFLIQYTGIGAIFLLVWECQAGTVGINKYGPNPLGNAASSSNEVLDKLQKLKELKDKGVLTEEEFNEKRAQLLGNL